MDTTPASENLPPLRRELSARAGTMSTVRAGLHIFWWSLATFDPDVRFPSVSVNTFLDGSSVWMNGSPIFPALYVHYVYKAADGMVQSSTPLFSCSYVRGLGEDGSRILSDE